MREELPAGSALLSQVGYFSSSGGDKEGILLGDRRLRKDPERVLRMAKYESGLELPER